MSELGQFIQQLNIFRSLIALLVVLFFLFLFEVMFGETLNSMIRNKTRKHGLTVADEAMVACDNIYSTRWSSLVSF